MANYSIIQGQTGFIDPATSAVMTGWSVDGVLAYHAPCFPGIMTALSTFGLQVGRQYVFTYTVSQVVGSGDGAHLIAGTNNTAAYNDVNGTYTETLTMTGNAFLSFYGDGQFAIGPLSFYDLLLGPQSGRTVTFNERENHWVEEWSFTFDRGVKFVTKMFMFQNGNLWQQNVNPVQNSFFGTKYPAKVILIVNKDQFKKKLWYNMRVDSTGNWYVQLAETPADDQFPNGMQTKMSLKNVKFIDGKLWADILRDINDPNFSYVPDPTVRQAMAMFQGRLMQGDYLIITLQNDDDVLATLRSVETYYIDVKKSL